MATCGYCGSSGFLLRCHDDGTCERCASVVRTCVESNVHVLNDSYRIVRESKSYATRLSRLGVIEQQLGALIDYSSKGLKFSGCDPRQMADGLSELRRDVIFQEVANTLGSARQKAAVAATAKQRVAAFAKALLRVQEVSKELPDPVAVQAAIEELAREIHQATVDGYVGEAEKAEFKNQLKKALDRYQEALYFLTTDRVPDDAQMELIEKLKVKIASLQPTPRDG